MTLFSLFLIIHILGAICAGVVVLQSLIAIFKKNFTSNSFISKALTISTVFQVVTGLGLTFTSSSPFISSCAKIGIYIVLIAGTKFLLQYTATKYQQSPSV